MIRTYVCKFEDEPGEAISIGWTLEEHQHQSEGRVVFTVRGEDELVQRLIRGLHGTGKREFLIGAILDRNDTSLDYDGP